MKLNHFFNYCYYINLDKRTERREFFEEQMKSIHLLDFAQRFQAFQYQPGLHFNKNDQADRHGACGMSHRMIIKKAQRKNIDKLLIFEDDIVFTENGLKYIESGLDTLSKINDWGIVYFSAFVFDDVLELVAPNLIKANYCLTAHAIGINSQIYDILLKYHPFKDIPIDQWINTQPSINKYVIYPLAIYQKAGESDLDILGKNIGIAPYNRIYNKQIKVLYQEII
jgi:hypothetical protein